MFGAHFKTQQSVQLLIQFYSGCIYKNQDLYEWKMLEPAGKKFTKVYTFSSDFYLIYLIVRYLIKI
jgi:hypothetical protein